MTKKHAILFLLILACISYTSHAQIDGLPNPSATQIITQDLGLGKVTVTYSRPNVKSRNIFGGLVPYRQIWRTGANAATTITLSENVIIEDHDIPAGTYALFCIPQPNEWTIILNKTTTQWGAYTYNQANDLLRFTVKTGHITDKQESFTIQFNNVSTQSVDLHLLWDHTDALLHLKSNDDAKIMANIDRLTDAKDISKDMSNLIYFNSIQYYYNNNKDIDKALTLIAKAENAFPQRASYKLFKSRFLLRKNDKAGARAAAEAGIRLAKENNDQEYLGLNQQALAR